jgi:DNA-binding winged helix-turn-helix (wHTH) protein
MNADAAPRSVELAEEAAFALAGAEVRPATLEVIAGERRELLEPRVMQVLVALARRRGEMVSRDDLIEQCWGGRIVGEDAITRALAQLRKLARSIGGFKIETVPRVGVRLVEHAEAPRQPRGRASAWAWVAAAAVAAVLALAYWVWRNTLTLEPSPPPRIAVSAFSAETGDANAERFSARIASDLAGALGESPVGLGLAAPADDPRSAEADFLMRGQVFTDRGRLHVRAELVDKRAGVSLWARRFDRPLDREDELRAWVVNDLLWTLYAALEPLRQEGLQVGPDTLALNIQTSQRWRRGGGNLLQATEELVASAPRYVNGRARLARVLAASGATPDERARYERRARAEAMRAIQQSPRDAGAAYDALALLESRKRTGKYLAWEDGLLKGLAHAPDHPFLNYAECHAQMELGFLQEAVRRCERAASLLPFAHPQGWIRSDALYLAGDKAQARDLIARIARANPDWFEVRLTEFEYEAFDGSISKARILLQGIEELHLLHPREVASLSLCLTARETGRPQDIDRAMASLWETVKWGPFDRRYFVFCAVALRRYEDAYRLVSDPELAPNPGYITQTFAAPLRRDQRFWPIVARTGKVRYWLARDRWPDFCKDAAQVMNCRAEAMRVAHIEPDP